jgi:hypothetical protein
MEFKLPIQYINHEIVDAHVIQDLELIDSEETSVYDKLFSPKTPESKHITREWAKYYTTNEQFLKQSVVLFKSPIHKANISEFVKNWNAIQENKEFKIKYQYVENAWLSSLNTSPLFLMFISFYFITSPLLLLLSPFLMMIIPFFILKVGGHEINWESYMFIFKSVIKKHAIGGLLLGFNEADNTQRMYLIGTAIFFLIQLYTNAYSVYVFYTNMNHVYNVIDSCISYIADTVLCIHDVQDVIVTLPTYDLFNNELEVHKNVLLNFGAKLAGLRSLKKCGSARAIFYEFYDNKELNKSFNYTIGFHGFVQTIHTLKKKLGKSINPCTFSLETSFCKAYYPIKNPIKNTYSLDKNVIITGPNASGKTTILKTTLINVLLSQQIGCGFYKSAQICPYEAFYCYINIPDTSGRDSLFQAEARRCKEIVDEVIKKKRMLCIFDELFSGTNPYEAIAGSCSLLTYLSNFPTFRFLLTTHFIDVCENLKKTDIQMKHMKTIRDVYTYKLTNGISYVKGGIKVLKQLNFPESIVKGCNNYADKINDNNIGVC